MLIERLWWLTWTLAPDDEGAGDKGGDKTQASGSADDAGDKGDKGKAADAGGDAGDSGDEGHGDAAGKGAKGGDDDKQQSPWPENWQELFASGVPAPKGEKEASAHKDRLSKFFKARATPADVLKAALGADSKISELTAQLKGMVKLPGDKATPEEKAAFRKAAGIPETADKYAVYRPEKFEPTEDDVAQEKTFLEAVHAADLSQRQVDAVLKTHYLLKAEAQKTAERRAQEAGERAIEDLRVKYGRDYKANVTLADRWLQEHLGPDMGEDWRGLMDTRFADGIALGEHPGFVEAVVKLARAWADDGDVPINEGGGAVDIAGEIKGIMAKMGTDEYKSPALQERLDRLIALQSKRRAA